LETRRKRIARDNTRSLERHAPKSATSLPNIAELIQYGQITLGVIGTVGPVAIASDGHNTLAMLVRRDNETLEALLQSTKRSTKKSSPTKSIAIIHNAGHTRQYGLLRTLTLGHKTQCLESETCGNRENGVSRIN
jgi:hypothetical protein